VKNFLIIITCLVAVAALALYFVTGAKKELDIADVLPQEIQLYMHFDNVSENIEQISQGPLWRSISQIKYEALVQEEVLSPTQVLTFNTIKSKLGDPQVQMILNKLFGREFAIAIYPLNVNLSQVNNFSPLTTPTFIDDALSNIMIVSRISPDVKLVEFFSGLLGNIGENAKKETLSYKEFTIHSIVFTKVNFRIVYMSIKDLLVVSLSERAAQKVIDVYLNERPALREQSKFSKAQKGAVEDDELSIYWDMGKFFTFIKDQSEALAAFIERMRTDGDNRRNNSLVKIESALESFSGFESFFISGRLDSITEFKFSMTMDTKNISSEMAHLYSCDPVENKSLQFVPADVLAYQWSGCIDLKYYWDQFNSEFNKVLDRDGGATAAQQISSFESMMGLSIARDIIPAFGDEFGGILYDIHLGAIFPIPKFMLFAEVNNQKKADKILSLLDDNPMFVRQEEKYNGVTINYFTSPMGGEDLEPSYAYIGDYLVIAINRGVIKNSLDVKKNASLSLSSDPDFKEIDKGLSDKNLNVFYVRLGDLAGKFEDLVKWGNSWNESQQRQRQALKAGSEQRLEIVLKDLVQLEGDIEDLNKETEDINQHIAEFKEQGLDASASEEELNNITSMIENKRKDIVTIEAQRDELQELIDTYEDKGISKEKRELVLKKLVYPLIDGLRSIEVLGGRATVKGDVFESNLLLKILY